MEGGSGDRQESLWRFLLHTLPHLLVSSSSSSYFCTQLGQASPPHTADRMMYRITWGGNGGSQHSLTATARTWKPQMVKALKNLSNTLLSLHTPAADKSPWR